ncbi:type IV secretion system DNA-binding domain-containing protein [Bacillus sp. E(2018)]|uniref:type IV secretion system DNA-binding domain-containing protein n=1 Tax=Bacillus sp. E(2018) TaxID=2502239 RepID=UPI0010F5CD9F|nr:type IV secretion system DNA-binding domain-containing protein [Bacillus sp. E(2018)]
MEPLMESRERPQSETDRLIGDLVLYLCVGVLILFFIVPAVIGLLPFFLLYTVKRDLYGYLSLSIGCTILLVLYVSGTLFSYLGVLSSVNVPFVTDLVEQLFNKNKSFPVSISSYLSVLALSLIFGFLYYIYATYFYKRRITTKSEEVKRRKDEGRYKRFREKRVSFLSQKQLQYRNQEKQAPFIGYTDTGEHLELKPHEMNYHMLATGGTGTGKTTLIASIMESALKQNKPVIFFDGKGERKSMLEFKALAEAYGKEVYLFSESDHHTYNPIKNGTPTETRDKLMSLFSFSTEGDGAYYTDIASRYLQLIIKLIDESNETRDLHTITKLTNLSQTKKLFQNETREQEISEEFETTIEVEPPHDDLDDFTGTPKQKETKVIKQTRNVTVSVLSEKLQRIKNTLDDEFPSEIVEGCLTRLRMQLGELIESDLGSLFTEKEGGIDLRHITENNNVVIFSISGSRYADYIKRIGKLVILDVNSLVAHRQEKGRQAIFAVYDEFSAYGDRRMVDIVNKSRSAGFECIISTQTLSDIDSVDPVMTEQIISNCNIIATGRVNSAKDAERIAEVFGTYQDQEVTQQVERKNNRLRQEADMGTVRDVERFKANPREIKNLQIGEIFINRKMVEEGLGDTYFRRVYVRNALDLGGLSNEKSILFP